jgi:transposase InsO family protein
MTSVAERAFLRSVIEEAVAAGARRARACAEAGLSARTLDRWRLSEAGDRRPQAERPVPGNRLSDAERAQIEQVANSPAFASVPPGQIVPALADTGIYLASESTFYRVLKERDQQHHRGRAGKPKKREPTTHCAEAPNQLWCWDITWLPTTVRGMYFYWYMIKDVFSRKIVGSEVYAQESTELASTLLKRSCLAEAIAGRTLILHSDNGGPMKGGTMLATMQNLGVMPSFSRPRVSNDNAYAETLFRTAKYCPLWPEKPFDTLDEARAWVRKFVSWYNGEHRHSALKFITPNERHAGMAGKILENRSVVYAAARERHPERWSGKTRNWSLEDKVWLNRERDPAIEREAA